MALDRFGNRIGALWTSVRQHLNFFRIHLLFFLIAPLVVSAIFYAANGEHHVAYIDALFVCVSALTVCGLATIDLSGITVFQQVLLFILSAIGNTVVISWVMVYVRRWYFVNHLQSIVEAEMARRKALQEEENARPPWRRALSISRTLTRRFTTRQKTNAELPSDEKEKNRLSPGTIRRVDTAPKRIDPIGEICEEPASMSEGEGLNVINNNSSRFSTATAVDSDQFLSKGEDMTRRPTLNARSRNSHVAFSSSVNFVHDDRTYVPPGGVPLVRRTTTMKSKSSVSQVKPADDTINQGLGGFPYPTHLLRALFLKTKRSLLGKEKSMSTYSSQTGTTALGSYRKALDGTWTYFSDRFEAIVGRNSKFYSLTDEHMEELGGVEFGAINSLLWIIAVYHFGIQAICFVVIAPYMSISRWKSDLEPPNLLNSVNPVWFSLFQVNSAYTTTGMSLVDQSMVPFREAYPLVFLCFILILAGSIAYPILLRAFIWTLWKLTPSTRFQASLRFLLDHPRRCYTYLFPSQQTYLLLIVLVTLTAVDWLFFEVLSLGMPAFDAIPVGVRAAVGPLQGECVRAAGFAVVPVLNLAPALQIMYLIGMYLGVYPIALSVRSTNVYEEKSLGVYEEEEEEEEPEESSEPQFLGRYLTWHARRQLAFDMWWLVLALFLLCVFERHKLLDDQNFAWFTIFSVLFELISAYSAVGLSVGVPYDNFSMAGSFTVASKLVLCVVMIRGRHRALPVAIDRAVLLPSEFQKIQESPEGNPDSTNNENGLHEGRDPNEKNSAKGDPGAVRLDATVIA